MTLGQTNIRRNYEAEAKARIIRRQAELETLEQNKQIPPFIFKGFGFRAQYNDRVQLHIEGPLCPATDSKGEYCLSELEGTEGDSKVKCPVCGFSGTIPVTFSIFRNIAMKKHEGRQRYIEAGGKIETLDTPFNAIKAQGKDETREIQIKWAQKDGRNVAVVYFIDRCMHDGEKVQVFVDIDRKELRHDASDTPPGEVVAKLTAEFSNTVVTYSYNDEN